MDKDRVLMELYLTVRGPVVLEALRQGIERIAGKPPEVVGEMMETAYRVERPEAVGKQLSAVVLYAKNALLEVVSINRDDDPLVFDERLLDDLDYEKRKATRAIASKLAAFTAMWEGKTVEDVVANMEKLAQTGRYQRVRYTRIEEPETKGEKT